MTVENKKPGTQITYYGKKAYSVNDELVIRLDGQQNLLVSSNDKEHKNKT